jgi:putative ABC transport system permease protein
MSLWSRLLNVVRSTRLDEDLEDEQRFHLEARAAELEARGLTKEAALTQATRQFGNRLRLRETSRDVRLLPWLESLGRDLRLGVRLLRKDAVVSLAAIASLGLAIGACTAAFALIDALILRQLPVKDPYALVRLNREGAQDEPEFAHTFSYPQFERVRDALSGRMDTFSMSEQSMRQAVLPDAGGAEEKVETQYVSGNAFNALGVRAALGRLLMPDDDVSPGGHQVAVISHAFWTRRLGGAPAVLGQWIAIEQKPFQIVGVAQAGFTGGQPGFLTDVWIPNMMFQRESLRSPRWNWLQIWIRVPPGDTRETVEAMVKTTLLNAEGITKAETEQRGKKVAEAAVSVVDASTGVSPVRRLFRRPLLALAVIVGIVLLIACSNIANLLLARGAARTREMALRASIGAGRGRLIQQVLLESSVLTLAATVFGVLCANLAVPLLVGMLTTNEDPVYIEAGLDWRVVTFVAALGCLTTMIFGLVPALRAASTRLGEATAVSSHRYTAHAGAARWLVAMQIAFSLMILFVAGLLLRSFDRLLAVDLGFNPNQVTLLSIEMRDRLEPAQAREIGRQVVARVQSLSGVESASMSGWALFRGWSWGNDVGLPSGERAPTSRLAVSPGFFRTMQARVLDGREFQPADIEATNPLPVIVNEAFARKYFPSARAVGQVLSATQNGRPLSYTIVGIVADVRDRAVRGPVGPYLYSLQTDPAAAMQVRSSLDPRTLADRVRSELSGIHPSLRLVDVTRQSALVMNTLLRERLLAVLSGFFAALGLALAAVGLYGVTSFAVVRRTREIGIRVTLGAQAPAIVRSVIGGILLAVTGGIVIGLVGGIYFSGFVRTFLFETEPSSLSSLALPVICLLIVACVAAWSPARRATRIDPAEALRME